MSPLPAVLFALLAAAAAAVRAQSSSCDLAEIGSIETQSLFPPPIDAGSTAGTGLEWTQTYVGGVSGTDARLAVVTMGPAPAIAQFDIETDAQNPSLLRAVGIRTPQTLLDAEYIPALAFSPVPVPGDVCELIVYFMLYQIAGGEISMNVACLPRDPVATDIVFGTLYIQTGNPTQSINASNFYVTATHPFAIYAYREVFQQPFINGVITRVARYVGGLIFDTGIEIEVAGNVPAAAPAVLAYSPATNAVFWGETGNTVNCAIDTFNFTRVDTRLPGFGTYPPLTVLSFAAFPDKVRRIDVLPGILDSGREILLVHYETLSGSITGYALFTYEVGPNCALAPLPVMPPVDLFVNPTLWSESINSDTVLGFFPAPNPVLYSTPALYAWPGIGAGDSLIFMEFDRATGALDILCRDNTIFGLQFLRGSVALQPVNATFAYGRFQFDYFNGDQRDFQRGGTLVRILERSPPTTTPPPPTTSTTGTTGIPPPVTTGTTGTTGVPPPVTTGTTAPPTTTGGGGSSGDSTDDKQTVVIASVVGGVFGGVLLLLVLALATVLIVSLQRPGQFRPRDD